MQSNVVFKSENEVPVSIREQGVIWLCEGELVIREHMNEGDKGEIDKTISENVINRVCRDVGRY